MNKYRSVIEEARKPVSQNNSKPAEAEQPGVNLSIKVPKSLRRHWAAEAKRQDTTVTAAIVEALKARFGEPIE